jgi:hypothetical protein
MYAQKLKAGKRRTYFFDVRATKYDDYYITITESKRKFNDGGYERHKIFLYKEDFNKFVEALQNAVDHIKSDLMPDYDFDQYNNPPEVVASIDVQNRRNEDYDGEDDNDESMEEETVETVSEDGDNDKSPSDDDVMTWD